MRHRSHTQNREDWRNLDMLMAIGPCIVCWVTIQPGNESRDEEHFLYQRPQGSDHPRCAWVELFYDNWSTEAFIYRSIRGTYSLLWLVREATYPDRRFENPQPLWIGTFFIFLPLAGYDVTPHLLISRHLFLPPRPDRILERS